VTEWAPEYPILTERLALRPHRESDLDDLVEFHGDPEVTRYIPWPIRDREQTREALDEKLSRGVAAHAGDWLVLAIEVRTTGKVIGEVLLKRSDDTATAELGYVLHSKFQGFGLATEAAAAMTRLALESFGVGKVLAFIEPENEASAKLLGRLGFVRAETLDHEGVLGYSTLTS
jgi:RimJ/RimL family protein N-acetyltransferase